MAGRAVKKCYGCKQEFRSEELVYYASPLAKSGYNYCPKCLEEKMARERFSDKVCQIFGIKTPGPRIWTERKRIQEKYGYTDDVIADCLDYIYNVEHMEKLSESLFMVTPVTVERMKKYKKRKEYDAQQMINALQIKIQKYIVPIKENTTNNKSTIDLSEWLED